MTIRYKIKLMLTLLGVTVISITAMVFLWSDTTPTSAIVLSYIGRSEKGFTYFPWTHSGRVKNSGKDEETEAETQNQGNIDVLPGANDVPNISPLGKQRYYKRLRDNQMESVDLHEFKSDYIIDPIFYEYGSNRTRLVPANSKPKIISCINFPNYFILKRFNEREKTFFNKCPYNNCQIDAYGKRMKEADLLLILQSQSIMPPRPQGQIWAHCDWEPPGGISYPGGLKSYSKWKGVFNWTCGYMRLSELYSPYGKLAWRAQETLMPDDYYIQYARRKTKTAAWWVSRCNAPSNRDRYVKEMQKYIDIDIYGGCGALKCSRNANCLKMLNDTYKFYLAFENSFCTDYVTEKFFKLFQGRLLVVPVVRGGFDYKKYFYPGTYINSKDFKNAKELALYLKELSNNLPEYARILKEKDRLLKVDVFDINEYCALCQRLHEGVEHRVIPDLKKVRHPKDHCWNVQDVF